MNKIERPHYLQNLIIAFILGTVIFVAIFALSYTISYSKLKGVFETQEQLKKDILSYDLYGDFSGMHCENFNPYNYTGEMDRIGGLIGVLEERLGKDNFRVREQKEIYSMLEARHFSYILDYNKYCRGQINTILFFYSNLPEYKRKSEDLGYILTTLKNKEPEIMIYSFDYDLNASIISTLTQKYNISESGQIVVNEYAQNSSLQYLDEIQTLIK